MRTIFIDFDGIICFDRLWRSLPQEKYALLQEKLFKDRIDLVYEWMRGKHTSEEINKKVSKWIDVPHEELWNIFVADAKNQSVAVDVLNKINSLRKNNFVVLITGNMDHFFRFTVPSLKLSDYFDLIISSYEEGLLKTDNGGETFLKHVRGNIEDSFLIEDSKSTCEVFEKLGGTALQISNKHSITDHLELLENL